MAEPGREWPVARPDEDWLTRTWKIVRWPLYAVVLIVILGMASFLYVAATLGD